MMAVYEQMQGASDYKAISIFQWEDWEKTISSQYKWINFWMWENFQIPANNI